MIAQLIFSTLLLLYFLGFGLLFQKIFPKINSSISFVILNGMIGVGLLSFLLAFFIPLNFTYEAILILISILSLIYHRKEVQKYVKELRNISRYFYIFSFLGLLVATTYPFILDHFGYYIPTIKWLDFAGFVKGLSNLEWVLAQNSFWHILQAAVNESLDVYYRLNISLFIVFNLYVFDKKCYKLLFFNTLFLFFLNSPSPDLPVFVITILLINEYLNQKGKVSDYLFYSTILVVIKPISIVLLIFFLIEYLKNKEYRFLKDKNILLIIFFTFLFCCKGIIVSSNPLFPISFSSIENLQWSSPKSMYDISKLNGKFIPLKDSFTFEEVMKMNSFEYLYAILFQNAVRSIILLFIIGFTLLTTIISFFYKKSTIQLLIFCCWIKLFAMLFLSPQFRFLLDILVIDVVLILSIFNHKTYFQFSKGISFLGVFAVSLFILFPNLGRLSSNSIRSFSYQKKIELKQLLQPGTYREIPTLEKKIGNILYNYPTNYPLIYNSPVPAISTSTLNSYLIYNGYPQQIDSLNVKNGFYFVQMNENERKKITEFLMQEQKKQAN